MPISAVERLLSDASTLSVGVDRDTAASNAANSIGGSTYNIDRLSTNWPSITKYDNDNLPSGSPSPLKT